MEYDQRGNCIYSHYKSVADDYYYEVWEKYDHRGNLTYYKNSNGMEEWMEYDQHGNCICKRKPGGYEEWWVYDQKGNFLYYEDSEGCKKVGDEYWIS